MNVPISRNDNILNGENLSPSETVVTDSDTNLSSVPYSSTSQPNSFVYRDASGNASVNSLTISGLSPNELLMTNGSNQVSSSNTIPFNNLILQNTTNSSTSVEINNASSQNILRVDTTGGGFIGNPGSLIIPGWSFFSGQVGIEPGNFIEFYNSSGYYAELSCPNSAGVTISCPQNGTNLTIYSGSKGTNYPTTSTPGYITYGIPGSGPGYTTAVHYFNNNVEINGNLNIDSLSTGVAQINGSNQLITSNTIASPTFTGTTTVATGNVQYLTVEPPSDGVCFSITSPNFGNFITANTYTGPSFNVNQGVFIIQGNSNYHKFQIFNGSGSLRYNYDTNGDLITIYSSVNYPSLSSNSLLQTNGSNNVVASNTLPSGCTIPSPQINGTISSAGNLGISAPVTCFGSSTSQFTVENGVGTNILNCNASSLSVTTHSNTIDDGSGNLTTSGNITTNDSIIVQNYTSTPHSTQFTSSISSGIKTGYVASASGTFYPIAFSVPSTAWGVWMYTVSLVAVGLFPNNANSSTSYPQSILITNNASGVAGIQNSSAPTITQNNTGLTTFSWSLSGNTLRVATTGNTGQSFNVVCNYQIMFCGTETDT